MIKGTFNVKLYFKQIFTVLNWRASLQNNVFSNRDEITIESLSHARLLVITGPQENFTESELVAIRRFLGAGRSLLVLVGEGGEKQNRTNISNLTDEYGISFKNGKHKIYKYIYWLIVTKFLEGELFSMIIGLD